MDPAIVAFGFGIGLLVGMTGMGGASLMTPLLILIFGVQPVTAIGTDIFYAAVTKTVGGVQHLRAGTVHKGLAFWMAAGSVPAAIGGVAVIEYLKNSVGEDQLDGIVFGILGATLLVVGVATALRTIFIPDVIKERFALHLPANLLVRRFEMATLVPICMLRSQDTYFRDYALLVGEPQTDLRTRSRARLHLVSQA